TYTATALNSTSITYSVLPVTAGVINPITGVMNWDAAFSGTATITATSTGLCGTTSTDLLVTVNPSTGPTIFTAGATTLCQDAPDETYTATATNSTSITYSVLPVTAGVINPTTGVMNWDAAFSGTATITATSTGLCGTTSADLLVTVNPSTGPTIFTAGATTLCQDSPDETYTATALNSTSITYSVLPVTAGVINPTTGVMNWDADFSGSATITATSTGLCGTTSADLLVTVNPSTGPTIFIAGATTLCQDAPDETYTAIATNSTSITYSVLPVTAGVINPTTGVMNWDAAFIGTATITATSTGLCGTTSANMVVTVNPYTGPTIFTAGATTVCQDAPDETYTAIATNSTSIIYTVLPLTAGVINPITGIMNWEADFIGIATITATSTGLCGTTSADLLVTVNPSTGPTIFTSGATTVCQDASDETYTATATNSTSTTYSVLPVTAGVINPITGVMNWDADFSGMATITATSTGLCGTTSADLSVTVSPSAGPTIFTTGATTVCQDAPDETYTATATNSTSITYSVLPVTAGVINPITGVMNWDADFSGTATIMATSTGLCGTTSADLLVTVNPSTGVTIFIAGMTSICQDAGDETYSATAANSTSIIYSVLPVTAGVINSTTGVMNWDADYIGQVTITATSSGLCGTTSADLLVTISPSTGLTLFIAGATSVCQDSGDETYSATAANSTSIIYSVLPPTAGVINSSTGVMNWDAAFSGTATITATSTGLCGETSADRLVNVTPTPIAAATGNSPVCEGSPITLTAQTVVGGIYSWTGPNGYSSSDQNPEILSATITDAGTYTLSVSVNGCSSVPSPVIIEVTNCAGSDLGVVKTADNYFPLIGHTIVFTIIATNYGPSDATGVAITEILENGYTYVSSTTTVGTYSASSGVWTIGSMISGASETLRITAVVNSAGTYVNTATISGNEPDGNLANNVSTIEPEPRDFFIPEGFSPNGDGTNDLFVIRGILYYPDNNIIIFNRWGNKVFEASPYQNTWDGKTTMGISVGGDELPVGTYFYLLDLDDGSEVIKGTIYLNR
ncbi:MAG: hypothetical protein CVT99_09610, partial [Bacteroidetes bacterium HGW-Bacteroidetes-16]